MTKLLRYGLVGIGVVFAAVAIRACGPFPPPTDFTYGNHLRPRVFVSHEPLIPRPGDKVTIRLTPDLASGASVAKAFAKLRRDGGGALPEQQCAAQSGGTFACAFTLGTGDAHWIYTGRLELAGGERVAARAEYRFSVLAALPADQLVEIRVPVTVPANFLDMYRIDVAFARDPENFDEASFVDAIGNAMFNGILADPVYRWRDNQLGFHLYTRPGLVESYYVPRDTRCGKNPWPADPTFPFVLSSMEVVGVLHRKTTSSNGIEGSRTAPASVAFRDCAGNAVKRMNVGTFSANAAIPEFVSVAKHEFGHAAFGLGDEYTEPQSTREVVAQPPPPFNAECCCQVQDTTGTTGGGQGAGAIGGGTTVGGGGVGTPVGGGGIGTPVGGGGVKRCIAPGGQQTTVPLTALDSGLPACVAGNANLPLFCGASPDGGCPSLAGNCIRPQAWLGGTPPASGTLRPNVFASQQECNDARQKAAAHPAVEDVAASLGTCRQICGGTLEACPCGGSEFWIVDIDPHAVANNDTMAVVAGSASLQGGTCQWCVDTSLCVRWHRARGDDIAAAWGACEAPPKEATQFEKLWAALLAWLDSIIAAIEHLFQT